MAKKLLYLFFISFLVSPSLFAQDIELYQQYNGRYDYLAIGNTLNLVENHPDEPCDILTQSSAQLTLTPQQTVIAAYLYWAGSGPGDLNIKLNGVSHSAQRTFGLPYTLGREFFGAFVDVTTQVKNTGNGNYTFSEMDLTNIIAPYCSPNGVNFGGWSIIVVYQEATLPLNQINIYDGFEMVDGNSPILNITIDNLNVIDTQGAKIGFLAWEGDSFIAVTETLQINGNILSNLPLNPPNNAFNSTNSFTGSNQLWNMDIDVYDMANYIQIGDVSAQITITSGQDMVIINNIITVVNSELPDATIEIDNITKVCDDREIFVEYTVYNVNSTAELPANTSIGFYADNTLIGASATVQAIPIGGSESGSITLTVPASIPLDFELVLIVDHLQQVEEISETNNTASMEVVLKVTPALPVLINQVECAFIGLTFDLTKSTVNVDPSFTITFHLTQSDAENNINPIAYPEKFENTADPQTIFVRINDEVCFVVGSFILELITCPFPDATITIDNDLNACRQRELLIEYTVYNTNGTAPLPEATPIAFYVDDILVAQAQTQAAIPIGGELQQSIYIELSDNVPDVFELKLVVDDIGDGTGIVQELDETNNEYSIIVTFGSIGDMPQLKDMIKCNEGFGKAIFDLTLQNEFITQDSDDEISFYNSYTNALSKTGPIVAPHIYQSVSNPEIIYVRLENEICFTIGDFMLSTKDCPPYIPQGFSPNRDGINDYFEISGLLNIFLDHEIKIYTRKGNLIFIGNQQTGFWDGTANTGLIYSGPVPAGVYYYVLNLNHPDYRPFIGWVYLNK